MQAVPKGFISFSYTKELRVIYGDVMTQKLKKADIFACNRVISSRRVKCNASIESSYQVLQFIVVHQWALINIWAHYDTKIWKIQDLTVRWAVWFISSVLNDLSLKIKLINICWPSRSRWRLIWNLLTVTCNCSILVLVAILQLVAIKWERRAVEYYHGVVYCISVKSTVYQQKLPKLILIICSLILCIITFGIE